MRYTAILGLAIITMAICITTQSLAQTEVYTQTVQGQDGPYSDGAPGYFYEVRTWDNFSLSDPVNREVTEVTWWGSSEFVAYQDLTNFDAWVVKIHADSMGEPGDQLYAETFAKEDTDPTLTGEQNPNGGWEYEQHVVLSTPVTLYIEETYWISIGAAEINSNDDAWIWSVNYTDGDGVALQDHFDGAGYTVWPDDVAFLLWGEPASGCPRAGCELGDANGDCHVDLSDLSTLLASYGLCEGDPGYNPAADFFANGCIDLSDLSALLGAYGADCNY